MLITKDVIISDVTLRVTQSKPSADLNVEKSQIAFIADQVRWKIVSDKLNAQFKIHYPIDPVYLFTERGVVPTAIPTPSGGNLIQATLQFLPLNLYRDRGVVRVYVNPIKPTLPQPNLQLVVDPGSPVEMITAADQDIIQNLKFSKPSLNNLKFRREGQNLIIHGLDINTFKMVTFTITYVPRISMLEDLGDNDIVPITEDLYEALLDETTKRIFDEMYNSFADVRNDAVQMTNSSDPRTKDKN